MLVFGSQPSAAGAPPRCPDRPVVASLEAIVWAAKPRRSRRATATVLHPGVGHGSQA